MARRDKPKKQAKKKKGQFGKVKKDNKSPVVIRKPEEAKPGEEEGV